MQFNIESQANSCHHVQMCCCCLLCAPRRLKAYAAIASQKMLQALASSHFIKLLNQL
jgi:hypothetical protein